MADMNAIATALADLSLYNIDISWGHLTPLRISAASDRRISRAVVKATLVDLGLIPSSIALADGGRSISLRAIELPESHRTMASTDAT